MGPSMNTFLGIAFLVVGTAATLLMYHLWGYPYDKEKLQSSAPRGMVNLHRMLGYIYLGIYIVLMWQMVPRLWTYQIELPARTVVHLTLGMTIGAILVLKIMIVQFFKHLEGTLIPFLGTTLMICTVLVIFLSVPFALRENYLRSQALPEASREESLQRVNNLLKDAGQEDEAFRKELASSRGLDAGRNVLYSQCTGCHDLRTVLAKPRTASNWWSTVKRMAERSDLLNPITEQQQWQVTAYLIAISPDLQKSVKLQRENAAKSAQAKNVVDNLPGNPEAGEGGNVDPDTGGPDSGEPNTGDGKNESQGDGKADDGKTGEGEPDGGQSDDGKTQQGGDEGGSGESDNSKPIPAPKNYSANVAKFLFEGKCSQCHKLDTVTNYTFGNQQDVLDILERMVDEGFEANEKEMSFIQHYLTETFVK